tara:strand:+ start:214 stop:459 length:246 start_codon:yes stop_codon:yes gene_type:complete
LTEQLEIIFRDEKNAMGGDYEAYIFVFCGSDFTGLFQVHSRLSSFPAYIASEPSSDYKYMLFKKAKQVSQGREASFLFCDY